MKQFKHFSYFFLFLIFVGCPVKNGNSTGSTGPSTPTTNNFYQVSGNTIVKNGKTVMLNGTNICNFALWEWEWDREPYGWYSVEQDYANIADWGADFVRLCLTFNWFTSDPSTFADSPGVSYIDEQLEFAKNNNMTILLDMHVAPGGFHGYDLASDGANNFWDSDTLQTQFMEIWTLIAAMYNDEPAILGYGLLNEPATQDSDSYLALMDTTINAIRNEGGDRNHIIFVMPGMEGYDIGGFPRVLNDSNVVYEIHFYDPFLFTHQGVEWLPGVIDPSEIYNYPGTVMDEKTWERDDIETVLRKLLATPNEGKVPYFLGEFGATEHAPADDRMQWYTDVYQIAIELGVDMITNWSFRDPEWGFYTWTPDEEDPGNGHQTDDTAYVNPVTDLIDLFKNLWSE